MFGDRAIAAGGIISISHLGKQLLDLASEGIMFCCRRGAHVNPVPNLASNVALR